MSITIYGENRAKVILPSDAGNEKPRTLLAKFLSKKEIRLWQKSKAEAMEIVDVDARDAAYDKLISEVITGWNNISGDFTVAGISDNYTLPEFMQLLDLIPMSMVPGHDDVKK